MVKLFHPFSNTGETECNDTVYNDSLAFDLRNNEYKITLSPLSGTLFWRFGLALSRNEEFDFNPSEGRYNNQSLRYIEIDVGEWINGVWEYPGRIALGSYYFEDLDSPIKRYETYIPESEVEIHLIANEDANRIEVSFIAGGCPRFSTQFPFDNYRFVKFFAWADRIAYELDCSILMRNTKEEATFEVGVPPSPGNNLWLLKLNTATWDISSFAAGTPIWHGSYNSLKRKRAEYDLYGLVKKGDTVLGYSFGNFEAIVCTLVVEKALHIDDEHGEVISLRVTKIFNPYIQAAQFLQKQSVYSRLKPTSPVRLLLLPDSALPSILAMDYDFPTTSITEDQRKYLEIIYQNWLNSKEINTSYSLVELWNDFPREFDPKAINRLLMQDERTITLWGISQIHPESDIFEKFDRVINTIKGIFSKGESLDKIDSKQIIAGNKDLTQKEVLKIFQLMTFFPAMSHGVGRINDGSSTLTMGEDLLFETYRKYHGLKTFMHKYLSVNGVKINTLEGPLKPSTDDSDESGPALFRTELSSRNRSTLSPVMGVDALAYDLANIIHRLPNEKGQMVGLFGRWGRGKTYLVEQTWKELDKKTEEIQYIRVIYDAWKFQETPASWAYLYEMLADKYLGKKEYGSYIQYYRKLFALNRKRIGPWPAIKLVAVIAGTFASWILTRTDYLIATIPFSIFLLLSLWKHLKKEFSTRAIDLAKKYSLRHSFKDSLGIQADIQAELIMLLKVWIPIPDGETARVKIILEVEDIDRCSSDKVISNIDALRVMLDDQAIADRMIILTAIDERILKNAICLKYESLEPGKPENKGKPHSGRVSLPDLVTEYLDKLFIIAIKLGALSDAQKDEFVSELLKEQLEKPESGKRGRTREDNQQAANQSFTSTSSQAGSKYDISPGLFGEKISTIDDLSLSGDSASITPLKGYPPGSWQKLTEWEHLTFKGVVRTWKEATPRSVSIFLFRYLLCKNMLVVKYEKVGLTNGWQDKKGVNDLMVLLKYYSDLHAPEKIVAEKDRVNSLEKAEMTIEVLGSGLSLKKSKTDYINLLEVLEIVIAY